jgi:hypothetical protein
VYHKEGKGQKMDSSVCFPNTGHQDEGIDGLGDVTPITSLTGRSHLSETQRLMERTEQRRRENSRTFVFRIFFS